jgi:hypothetical protein
MHQQLQHYAREVSALMHRQYAITWDDAAGDLQPLDNALADGLSPEEFVARFAEKYDLTPRHPADHPG